MNIEIKKGDHVFIPGVVQREPEGEFVYVEYKSGSHRSGLEYFRRADVSKLLIFPHEYGIKNTEPAPKYDPCRKFRKGDIVQVVERHGRNTPLEKIVTDIHDLTFTVLMDEDSDNDVLIETSMGDRFIQFSYLKLVTPVEERVSFRVGDFSVNGEWSVWKDSLGKTEIISSYKIDTHPNAKKAAVAELDRLNAEHRKEQK